MKSQTVPMAVTANYGQNSEEDEHQWQTVYQSKVLLPEHTLIVALIKDAMDQVRYSKSRTARDEAAAWLRGYEDDDEEYVFTFANCCEALGLNAIAIRRAVLGEREAAKKRDED